MKQFPEKLKQDYLENLNSRIVKKIEYSLANKTPVNIPKWGEYLSKLSKNIFGNEEHYGLANFFLEYSESGEALRLAERNFDLGWYVAKEGKNYYIVSNENKRVSEANRPDKEKFIKAEVEPLEIKDFSGFLVDSDREKLNQLLNQTELSSETIFNPSAVLSVALDFGSPEQKKIAWAYQTLCSTVSSLNPSSVEASLNYKDLLGFNLRLNPEKGGFGFAVLENPERTVCVTSATGFSFALNSLRKEVLAKFVFTLKAEGVANFDKFSSAVLVEFLDHPNEVQDFWHFANSESRNKAKMLQALAVLAFTDILLLGRKQLDLGGIFLEPISGRIYSYPVKGLLSHEKTEEITRNLRIGIPRINPYIHTDSLSAYDEFSSLKDFLPEGFAQTLRAVSLDGLTSDEKIFIDKNRNTLLGVLNGE